jgi:hypothetical protein
MLEDILKFLSFHIQPCERPHGTWAVRYCIVPGKERLSMLLAAILSRVGKKMLGENQLWPGLFSRCLDLCGVVHELAVCIVTSCGFPRLVFSVDQKSAIPNKCQP